MNKLDEVLTALSSLKIKDAVSQLTSLVEEIERKSSRSDTDNDRVISLVTEASNTLDCLQINPYQKVVKQAFQTCYFLLQRFLKM